MHDRKQFIGGTGVYIKGVSGTGLCIKGVTVYSADVDMRKLQIVMCSLGRIGVETHPPPPPSPFYLLPEISSCVIFSMIV